MEVEGVIRSLVRLALVGGVDLGVFCDVLV